MCAQTLERGKKSLCCFGIIPAVILLLGEFVINHAAFSILTFFKFSLFLNRASRTQEANLFPVTVAGKSYCSILTFDKFKP